MSCRYYGGRFKDVMSSKAPLVLACEQLLKASLAYFFFELAGTFLVLQVTTEAKQTACVIQLIEVTVRAKFQFPRFQHARFTLVH